MSDGDSRFEERMSELEAVLAEAEKTLAGPPLHVVRRIVGALLEAHEAGLHELASAIAEEPDGRERLARLAERRSIAALLSLHGIHPAPMEERVRRAAREADRAARQLGAVEVLSVEGSRARIRVRAKDVAAARTIAEMVDAALAAYAPDAEVDYELPADPSVVPVSRLARAREAPP